MPLAVRARCHIGLFGGASTIPMKEGEQPLTSLMSRALRGNHWFPLKSIWRQPRRGRRQKRYLTFCRRPNVSRRGTGPTLPVVITITQYISDPASVVQLPIRVKQSRHTYTISKTQCFCKSAVKLQSKFDIIFFFQQVKERVSRELISSVYKFVTRVHSSPVIFSYKLFQFIIKLIYGFKGSV